MLQPPHIFRTILDLPYKMLICGFLMKSLLNLSQILGAFSLISHQP